MKPVSGENTPDISSSRSVVEIPGHQIPGPYRQFRSAFVVDNEVDEDPTVCGGKISYEASPFSSVGTDVDG